MQRWKEYFKGPAKLTNKEEEGQQHINHRETQPNTKSYKPSTNWKSNRRRPNHIRNVKIHGKYSKE